MTDQEIRLKFGEMNAGEMRLARALVAWHEREIVKHKDALTEARQIAESFFTYINPETHNSIVSEKAAEIAALKAELAAAKGEGQSVVVNELPKSEKQPDLSGESEKQTDEPAQAQQESAQPWTPAVGDTVRLKSGGPAMTVTNVDPLSLMCAWMNASNELQVEPITTLCLEPAKP